MAWRHLVQLHLCCQRDLVLGKLGESYMVSATETQDFRTYPSGISRQAALLRVPQASQIAPPSRMRLQEAIKMKLIKAWWTFVEGVQRVIVRKLKGPHSATPQAACLTVGVMT